MNVGKTLFAQVMEFVPWKTFGRIIERHSGDAGVRTLGCADLFRVMAFSQLTWRESLRDIEACLAANQTKLFHMGIAERAGPLDAGRCAEPRDWRIYHALALRLIARARELYAEEPLVLDLDATRLCPGRHHHRSVPESVRLGAVSFHQGGGQDTYAAGLARRDPSVHPHQRRQAARCQRAGLLCRSRRAPSM